MALARLQQTFQAYLLAGDPAVRREIVDSERVSADTRLGIYANAYRLRLLEALTTDYPGLKAMAGDEEFERLGSAYIDAHPSRHRSLRWFGDALGEFLRTTEPYARYPVFAEMAAFEWAMSDAFDAEDRPPVTVSDMAAIAPDTWPVLTFATHPSMRRLDLRWNVPTVWKAIDTGAEPPALDEGVHPLGWLVWRADLLTHYRSLTVDEAWALDEVRRGVTFAAICAGLTEWIDAAHVASHAAGLLKRWIEDGLITGIRTTTHG